MKTVLILSNIRDAHSDDLVNSCHSLGMNCFRMNTDMFRKNGSIFFDTSENSQISLDDRKLNLNEVDLLIIRRPVDYFRTQKDMDPWLASLWDKEWACFEQSLQHQIKGIVVNEHSKNIAASNKISQYKVGNQIGLNIPRTFISTDSTSLIQFAEDRLCVSKAMGNCSQLYNGEMRTGKTVLLDSKEKISSLPNGFPILLQEAIMPLAMWRIVTVGKKTFGFRLSGNELNQEIDSRLVEEKLSGSYEIVPKEIHDQLQKLTTYFGIHYASSDLIEDKEGKLWFVDLNPQGQWGNYEIDFGIPISKEIVSL